MSDRDLQNWEQRLGDQVQRNWENYFRRRIHLDTARDLEAWHVSGEYIYVEQVSSESARASIRLNRNTNDELDLLAGVKIETVFKQIYLTHTAQPGEWLDLLIGINFRYVKPAAGGIIGAEVQQVLNLTHAVANTDVQAAANVCNKALIKADVENTGIAWIDFGTAAVQSSCIPLDPGEWITVSLSNTNRIHANFEVGGELVYIAYEV